MVLLPVAFVALAWWRRGGVTRADIWKAVPFVMLAGVLSLVTIWFQYNRAIADVVVREDGLLSRFLIAGRAVWFYLYKALLPVNLSFIYPRWAEDTSSFQAYLPVLALAAGLVTLWVMRSRSWARSSLSTVMIYIVMLFPMLGFLNIFFMRYSLVADHYQYSAMPAVLALVVAAVVRVTERWRGATMFRTVLAAMVISALGVLAWKEAGAYRDTTTLWLTTLARNPDAALAHNNLGKELELQGKTDEAVGHYQRALELLPTYAEPHNNLANTLVSAGQMTSAMEHYDTALRLQPKDANTLSNLGAALAKQGKLTEAIDHYRQALAIMPDLVEAEINMANAFQAQGKMNEAMSHYQRALELTPDDPKVLHNLGVALAASGKADEAMARYARALEIMPGSLDTRINLANALYRAGRFDDAGEHYSKVLETTPENLNARFGVGSVAEELGRFREAVEHFSQALKFEARFLPAQDRLAWILATCPDAEIRDGKRALQLAQEAARTTGGKNAGILRTLAASCAEAGEFSQAADVAQRAIDLAASTGGTAFADLLRKEREGYLAREPLRVARTPPSGAPTESR